jgi:hypothetical protein
MKDVLDVIKNIQSLYENNSNLSALKDFERVLAEMDLYAYNNWEDGELAYGPKIDRHWITAGFMWPQKKMPDPIGAKRLLGLGCKVKYQKSHLLEARPIRTPDDIRPGTKKGKVDRNPIWIVEIQMPKKVAFDMYKGYMDKMKAENADNTPALTNATAPATPAPTAPAMAPGMAPGGAAGGAPNMSAAGGAPAPAI